MTDPSKNRAPIALALGFFAVLAQLGAFTAITMNAWNDLVSPTSTGLQVPFAIRAEAVGGELVFPVIGPKVDGRGVFVRRTICLRAINPQTGHVRTIPCENVQAEGGLVANGDRAWFVGLKRVCETDGKAVIQYEPKRPLRRLIGMPFIYDGRLAVIDCVSDDTNRLLVLVEHEWVDKGQVAFPGEDRSWIVDERTGKTVLIPRTSANPTNLVMGFSAVQVVSSNGRIHLFQFCGKKDVCYREGFDFVATPAGAEVISAMAPANASDDTTGWVLLDSSVASKIRNNLMISFNDELYVADDNQIWRTSIANGLTDSSQFDEVAKVDRSDDGILSLVPSKQDNSLYAISASTMLDADVYQVVDGNLKKMPYHLDGIFESSKLWLGTLLLQGLVVVTAATAALIVISAWMTGRSAYSFGQDTVLLAPIVRRSLARCIDLALIFGPIMLHLAWFVWQANGTSLKLAIERIFDGSGLADVSPDIIWICLMWAAIVVSTGLWGLTPGKWLFGVRVVRTSLRRCGIFPALLRELMMFLDAPQLLTALPGLLCYLATENGQRIGDLAAGTLVIDARPMINSV